MPGDPIFVDAPAPKASGPVFVDAPAPSTSGIPLVNHLTPDLDDHTILTQTLGYPEAKAKEIMSAPGYKPGMFQKAVTDPNGFAAAVGHTVLGSLYKGAVGDPSAALGQLVSHIGTALGLNDPRNTQLRDAMVKLGKANYQQNWKGNLNYNAATGQGSYTSPSDFVGQAIGQAVPFIATEGKNPAALPAKLLSKEALPVVGKMAAQGGVYGALQPTSGDDFAKEKSEQIGLGALGGVVGGVVGQKVISPLVRATFSGLSKLPNALLVGKLTPEAQRIAENFEARGIEANPSEILAASKTITQPPSVASAKTAADDLAILLGQKTDQTPYKGLGRLQAAVGDNEAQDLAAKAAIPGKSALDTAQTAGAVQLKRLDLIRRGLWDKTDALAGPDSVNLGHTADAINGLRLYMAKNGDIPGLSSELDRLQQHYFPTRDELGRMVRATADRSFKDIKVNLIQRMNDILGSQADDADSKALKRGALLLKNALTSDLEESANKQGPAVWGAYLRANKFDAEKYYPTKDIHPFNLQNLFATGDASNPAFADELLSKLAPGKSGRDRATALGIALGGKGKAALAQAIVEDAIQKGGVDRTGTWVPGGAASALSKRMGTLDALLPNGPEKAEARGILTALQHLAAASPENASALGERVAQVANAAPSGGKIAGAFNFIKNGGIDLAFNSPKGKQILLNLARTKPGSPASESLVQQLIRLGSAVGSARSAPSSLHLPFAATNQNDDSSQLKLADLRNHLPGATP